MTILKYTAACFAVVTVAACSGQDGVDRNSNDYTGSRFVAPASDGAISAGLEQTSSGSYIDSDGDGFAYQAGLRNGLFGDAFYAVSGTIGDDALPALPATGTGSYSGRHEFMFVNRHTKTSSTAAVYKYTGNSTMSVDFESGAMTGSGDDGSIISSSHKITYSGSVANGALTGSVYVTPHLLGVNGMSGTLQGKAGSDKIVGAFHGNDDMRTMAGGVLVTR